MLTDGKNDGLTGAGHNDGVLEEDGIRVEADIFIDVLVGDLLSGALRSIHVRVVVLLVDVHIHFFDKDTVGGDAVALLEQDDVSNDKVLHKDGLGGAVLASKNSDLLTHDLLAELEELLLFTPVANGLDCAGEEHGEEDRDGLEPLVGVLLDLEE